MTKMATIDFGARMYPNMTYSAQKMVFSSILGKKMPNNSPTGCCEFKSLTPSTSIAYIFLTNKVRRTRLAAYERAEKILSEQHEFCPNWLKNSDTVIS